MGGGIRNIGGHCLLIGREQKLGGGIVMSSGGAIFQVEENEQIFGWWGVGGGGAIGTPVHPPSRDNLDNCNFFDTVNST